VRVVTIPEPLRQVGSVPEGDPVLLDPWRRLQDERRCRLEQLADLEAETPASPRHESVTRLLRASARVALAEIDAALARVSEGRYGVCSGCGGEIGAERLTVLPMAALCMSCHYNEQNCRLAAMESSSRAQRR
jgi:RNA polymerase-binding transcription factor DksA